MNDRKRRILRAIVETYVDTAEPVGSKAIANSYGLGLSPATIRNEMSDLTDLGYLEQPHTSAGRVPSPLGYRLYVDELMNTYRLTLEEIEKMNLALQLKMRELDRVVARAGQMISRVTHFPSFSLTPLSHSKITVQRFELLPVDRSSFIILVMTSNDVVKNKLVRLPYPLDEGRLRILSAVLNSKFTGLAYSEITAELVEAGSRAAGNAGSLLALVLEFAGAVLESQSNTDVFLTGTSNILSHPEYRDVEKARELLDFLSNDGISKLPAPAEDENIKILIGPENVASELKEASVIVASYDIGDDMRGIIGVVGPTRMDYAKVAARLSYFADCLKIIFRGGFLPPPDKK